MSSSQVVEVVKARRLHRNNRTSNMNTVMIMTVLSLSLLALQMSSMSSLSSLSFFVEARRPPSRGSVSANRNRNSATSSTGGRVNKSSSGKRSNNRKRAPLANNNDEDDDDQDSSMSFGFLDEYDDNDKDGNNIMENDHGYDDFEEEEEEEEENGYDDYDMEDEEEETFSSRKSSARTTTTNANARKSRGAGGAPVGGRPQGTSRRSRPNSSSTPRSRSGGRSSSSRQGGRPRRPNGNVVPYNRQSGRSTRYQPPPPSAFVRGLTALRESIPDPSSLKDTAINSLSAAKETTSKLTSNIYREVKGLTSSELEQVMLKATAPNDIPVKGKHVERLVGVTYQISGRYDIYDAVLRKLWSKMVEKDWRTTVKALYILHRFSADGAPDHQAALKARLRELRRTRDPKRGKEKYFNSKQMLSGDASVSIIRCIHIYIYIYRYIYETNIYLTHTFPLCFFTNQLMNNNYSCIIACNCSL